MAAKDYVFESGLNDIYLARKNDSVHFISQDRRLVSEQEILWMFEWFLTKFCIQGKTEELKVTDGDKEVIFEVAVKGKLLDKIKEEINADK